jgi:hypothetical protein
MKRAFVLLLGVIVLVLAACASGESTAEFSATPDPCASDSLQATIKPVNDLQREFDDASQLASNVPREQLPPLITEMQRIRRASEDQEFPSCLAALKTHQLAHMRTVIDTLLAFVGGADSATLNDGIAQAGRSTINTHLKWHACWASHLFQIRTHRHPLQPLHPKRTAFNQSGNWKTNTSMISFARSLNFSILS